VVDRYHTPVPFPNVLPIGTGATQPITGDGTGAFAFDPQQLVPPYTLAVAAQDRNFNQQVVVYEGLTLAEPVLEMPRLEADGTVRDVPNLSVQCTGGDPGYPQPGNDITQVRLGSPVFGYDFEAATDSSGHVDLGTFEWIGGPVRADVAVVAAASSRGRDRASSNTAPAA
jgi:hypothetical protein